MTDIEPRALTARLLARSRYAMPLKDALAHIEERRRRLFATPPPLEEPDFAAAESVNVLDDLAAYAKDFYARQSRTCPKTKPTLIPAGRGDNDNE